MSDSHAPGSEANAHAPGSVQDTPRLTAETQRNGEGPPHTGESPAATEASQAQSGMERAERIVDHFTEQVAERVAHFATSLWGKKVLTFAAHAREAAQDFWAEVQDVRHGKRP